MFFCCSSRKDEIEHQRVRLAIPIEKMDTTGRDYVREHMPIIGLGTYQIRSEKTIHAIIDAALEVGYRFIDTAQIYGNEAAIGRSLKELLPKHGLKREDIFITTKLSPANQGEKLAGKSIDKSLEHLQTDYIDLLIIHWPGVSKLKVHDPKNSTLRRETYTVMEDYYNKGSLKAIGVSNYEIRHLEELLDHATVLPALNQVEYHPHFHQTDLVNFCKDKNIHFQAYSSLGSPDYRDQLFNDATIKQLANKYKVEPAIFLLAWAASQNISILPRSSNPERVKSNFAAKDVVVSEEDIKVLLNNTQHDKVCWDPTTVV